MSGVRNGLKQDIGRHQAREFYKGKQLLAEKIFDVVYWDTIELMLEDKPKLYNLWYGKQCSGWCGTSTKLKEWGQTTDSRCPNYRGLSKDASHLTVCPCANQTGLFKVKVRKLEERVHRHHTDQELAPLITEYMLGQGKVKFACLNDLPSYLRGTTGQIS